MARGWSATCVLLLLAASALTASADLFTDDQIAGMIDSNCVYRAGSESVPPGATTGSHGLTHADCAACIHQFSSPTSTVEDGDKIDACFNLCQDPLNQLPGLSTVSPPSLCVDCLAAPSTTRESCHSCLALDNGAAGACLTYWINGPPVDNTTSLEEPAFIWAVAECFKFPTANNVRSNCLSCLEAYEWDNNIQTQYFGKCIDAQQQAAYIATGQWDKVNGIYAMCGADQYIDGTGLTPGQCYTCMKQVEAAFAGQVQDPITGPQLLRKPYGCAEYCQQETNPIAGTAPYQTLCTECLAAFTPADAWACGNCAGINPTANKADCYDCVMNDPYQGKTSNYNWACSECSKISNAQLRALCLQCISSQPAYAPKPPAGTSTSDPAYLAYLAFIEHTEANICSCVDLTWHAGSLNNAHPGVETIGVNRTLNAFELKCFMPQYNYSDAGNLLTPTIPWGADILPYYGADGQIYTSGANGQPVPCPGCSVNSSITDVPTSACIQCVDAALAVSTQQYPKQYACSEYCQDPATILPAYTAFVPLPYGTGAIETVSEGQDCSDCVTDPRVADPSDCKACITATNDLTGAERAQRRRECLYYVRQPRVAPPAPAPGKRSLLQTSQSWPNFGWAAAQCAQFSNDVARAYCYSCLLAGCEDPCDCVDAARRANSTSTYVSPCGPPPPGGGGPCTAPKYLWFWTWVPRYCAGAPGSCTTVNSFSPMSIATYTYKIVLRSTPNAINTGPGTGCVGGTPSQAGCTWLTVKPSEVVTNPTSFTVAGPLYDATNDNVYDVAAVRIDVSGVNFPTNAQCQTLGGSDCQFFLVVNNALATAGLHSSAISWDNDQVLTTTPAGDNTGFQNNNGNGWNIKNGLAIELDSCDYRMMYTSLAPYPTTSSPSNIWLGGTNTNPSISDPAVSLTSLEVYRMFMIGAPGPHPAGGDAHPGGV